MGKRHPNYRHVKVHRNYTVEEAANLFGIHKNTVREWLKSGLPVLDDKRPMLILGQDLAAFLQARRIKNKQTCQPGQMYCVRCRSPKTAAGDMADYHPRTEKLGMLKAICPDCHFMMNRHVSLAKLGHVRGKLAITFPPGSDQVSNSIQPTVNSDLERDIRP
jgi:excisionase family DNA binding protein